MTSTKLHVCYRKNSSGDDDVEFWSINKDLYDEYIRIYGKFLTDEYYQVVLPATGYEEFYKCNPNSELKLYDDLPWAYPGAHITTEDLAEALDPEQWFEEILRAYDINVDIFDRLPRWIRVAILKSEYFKVMFYRKNDEKPITSLLDIDYMKQNYLATVMYYTEKPIMEIDL